MQGNSGLARKAQFAMYAVPVALSLFVGGMHLGSQSFMIYLKYQAMVDNYYYEHVLQQPAAAQAAEAEMEATQTPSEPSK